MKKTKKAGKALSFLPMAMLLLVVPGTSFAQQKQGHATKPNMIDYGLKHPTQIGTSNVRIRYAFQPQNIKDENTWIDCGQLLACNGMTQYSSHFIARHADSLRHWLSKNAGKSYYPGMIGLHGRLKGYWSEYQYSQIYTSGNTLTEWAVMPFGEYQQWRYKESYPSMKWKLSTETATICGYRCQKATCHWRGRDYVAWFTREIPLMSGPWKFGGLPGLIMKVYDTKHVYTWQAVAVENGKFPVLQPEKRFFKDTTRQKVWKMQREWNVKYAEMVGLMYVGSTTPYTKRYPYSQLELE